MSFWEQHEESERAIAAALELEELAGKRRRRLPQDAPTECQACGRVDVDVMLGVCPDCKVS